MIEIRLLVLLRSIGGGINIQTSIEFPTSVWNGRSTPVRTRGSVMSVVGGLVPYAANSITVPSRSCPLSEGRNKYVPGDVIYSCSG